MEIVQNVNIPIEAVRELCRKYGVAELSVFGSALREDFRPDSDVDILVSFQPDAQIGLLEFAALQRQLSDILGRPVDLVSKKGLKPVIRKHVLDSAKVVYAI